MHLISLVNGMAMQAKIFFFKSLSKRTQLAFALTPT